MPQKTVLANGVRVVTEHLPWVRSVSVGCWLGSGSRDETPMQSGFAHIVEHMMFKGTTERTARDIAETMDATGGQLNAFTTKETTCYHCRVLDEHMPVAMELLADMLLHSTFQPEELARERTVILEEISLVEDTPEDLIHDLFDRQLFGTHPLALPVLGTSASVAGAQRDDLLHFVKTHYRAPNLVIAAVGNVAHRDVVDAAERLFGKFADIHGGVADNAGRRAVPLAYAPGRGVFGKEGEQVHLCVGAPGLRRDDPDRYALDILDTLFGGGMSSRLFQQLREEKGLVYSTYSFSAGYSDTGLFGCYAGTSPDRAEQVLELMLTELEHIYAGNVTEAEVERAKEQVKGSLLLSLESTGARMGRLAGSELASEQYLDAEQLSARFDEVSADDVRRVAARLLAPTRLSMVALGPVPANWHSDNEMEAIG